MTNTILKAREIELKDLETVSGGTVGEFEELIEAYTNNPYLGEAAGLICGHIPGVNNGLAALVESSLGDKLGIEADISLGFAGTGIGSDPNTYFDKATGQPLTHQQVLDRIKNYGK